MKRAIRHGPDLWKLGGLLLGVMLIVYLGAVAYYNYEFDRITLQEYDNLAAIGKLKTENIHDFRKGLKADVWSLSTGPLFRRAVGEWLDQDEPGPVPPDILGFLMIQQHQLGYAEALLTDTKGNLVASTSGRSEPITTAERASIQQALDGGNPVLSDLYVANDGMIFMSAAAPLMDLHGKVIAVAVYRSNAASRLFPMVQMWPTASETAETLLVEEDAGQVLFLNELRHSSNKALSIRTPMDNRNLPSAQAIAGKTGMFIGKDYRNQNVLADLRPIPESPWFMVTKVDADEILREARYRGIVITAFSGMFILLTGCFTAYWFFNRQARLYKSMYDSESRRLEILEEFRTTLYSIGDAVITTDKNGLVKLMNPVAEELTGWKESMGRNQPLDRVFHIVNEETGQPVENPVQRVLLEGKVVGLANHTMLISRDQQTRPIVDSGAPIRNAKGEIVGVVLVFRDQTEERTAQQRLVRMYSEVKQIFDVSVPLCVIDNDFTLLKINDSFASLFKTSFDEIVGAKCHEVWKGPLCNSPECMLRRVIDTKKHCFYEFNKRLPDDSVVSLIIEAKPFVDESGNVIGIIETFTDITERKLSEEKVRQGELRFKTVADFTHDWEYWVDQEGRMIYVSPSCERITGYSAKEFMNDPSLMARIVNPDEVSDVLDHFHGETDTQDSRIYKLDFRIIHRDGETRWLNHVCQPVQGPNGEPLGRRGSNRDITDQKSLETQFLHAQKMEALGTLAGGIAHDFNNLLQVILGYTEFVMMRKQINEEDYSHLEKVYESGKRGNELIRNLLLFSRNVPPSMRPVDINREIIQIHKLLLHTISKNIKIDLRLSGDIKTVMADPSQIGQILMNLGLNSRDAMPEGGTLSIESSNIDMDESYSSIYPLVKPGSYVLIKVSDSGHGMDDDTQRRIFEPFFTTKEAGKGSGLGLATAYAIMKQHSGFINCSSELGSGSVFRIFLPVAVHEHGEDAQNSEDPVVGGNETILLVDDEESIRDLVTSALSRFGYKVITASNGLEAIEIYKEKKDLIALVILDLMMPEMDGRRCLSEILQIDPDAFILVATGNSESDETLKLQTSLLKGFFRKPFDIRDLMRMIRKALDEK